MVATISIQAAYTILRSGQPFDLEVATLEGERKLYKGARLCAKQPPLADGKGLTNADTGSIADGTGVSPVTRHPSPATSRNPHHTPNGTLNISLPNHDVRKIFPVLIEKINGKKMLL